VGGIFSKHIVDGGLTILSRFPIIASDSIVFSKGISADSLAAKGVLYAKIEVSEKFQFHLFNTHLQASYHDSKSTKKLSVFERIRSSQLWELWEFIDKMTGDDSLPIVLAGDMNVIGGSEEYGRMMDLLNGKYFETEDILKKIYGYHPPTTSDMIFVDEEWIPREIVLTDVNSLMRPSRLDYIFLLSRKSASFNLKDSPDLQIEKEESLPNELVTIYDSIDGKEKPFGKEMDRNSKKIRGKSCLEVKECQVEQFFVKGEYFTQLSDHYGVSCKFGIMSE